jgi:SAM-dependent methyltransferase
MVRSMSQPPALTDALSLARNRCRAEREGGAMFLQEAVAREIEERLDEVNRRFTAVAVVTGFPQIWQQRLGPALLVPEAEVLVPEAEVLEFGPARHDLVVHAMGLHWASDPVGQMVQCRRSLLPDGLFLAALFGGRTLSELRACLAQAESEITGGLSPRVLPMAEIRDLGGLLQRAGFALPVADSHLQTVTYPDMFALMRDLRAMGEANAMAARLRRPTRRAVMARAAEIYAEAFPAAGGRVRATFETIFLTGWAPHESQPQPLRPGSARTRLADALGTAEIPLSGSGKPHGD